MKTITLRKMATLSTMSVLLSLSLVGCAARSVADGTTQTGPALPLPELTPDELALPDYPEGRPIANSLRAWHYNPKMVPLLTGLGGAVSDANALSKAMLLKMVAVVASRNGCRY